MATLSLPTNTPAIDGAVIGCATNDTTGTAYAMVRTDRQWYSVANGDSQALADADKATIIAQDITATELVWAGTDEDLATIQLTIDGLAARLDPANPYYVGWVQEDSEGINFYVGTAPYTFIRGSVQTGPDALGDIISQTTDNSVHMYADWDGNQYLNTSGLSEGVLLEGERTQMLVNPTSPATQDVTVTAVAHTMSVLGTGSVTLSGAATGTATEAAPLTFTPSAGTLTVTTAGSLDGFQLEIGGFESSFIPETITRPATQMTATMAELSLPENLVNDISGQIKLRMNCDYNETRATWCTIAKIWSETDVNNTSIGLSSGDDRIYFYKKVGGSSQNMNHSGSQYAKGELLNIRWRISSVDGMWMKVNEFDAVTNANSDNFSEPMLNTLIGTRYTTDVDPFMTVEFNVIWPEAKTIEYLEGLT